MTNDIGNEDQFTSKPYGSSGCLAICWAIQRKSGSSALKALLRNGASAAAAISANKACGLYELCMIKCGCRP